MQLTAQRKKQVAILGALLALWAWVLWSQISGRAEDSTANATTATVDVTTPTPEISAQRNSNAGQQGRRVIASPEVRARQRARATMKLQRNPFGPPLSHTLAPSSDSSSPIVSDPEVADLVADPSIALTSTFIGPRGNSAVVNGNLVREGETLDRIGVLRRVHDGWIELESPAGDQLRVSIQKRSGAPKE